MKSITERSAETEAAVRLLSSAAELEIVTYEALMSAIGSDPQQEGRHHVTRACEILAREAVEFAAVENVGLKRADDLIKVQLGRFRLKKAARQAKKSRRALGAVENWSALPEDKKREHNILAAQAGAMQEMATVRVGRRLGEKMDAKRYELKPGDSLKLMEGTL